VAKQPTRPQRLVVKAADPDTGLLKGTAAQLAALVDDGWAFRHPNPPHRCYLTPSGWALRERLLEPPPKPAAPTADSSAAPGLFAARTGEGPEPGDPEARAREVRGAWEGLLELRRMTNHTDSNRIPCPWERAHLVAAAGLALEAAGCTPSAVGSDGLRTGSGYHVSPWPQAGTVRVTWVTSAPSSSRTAAEPVERELARCAQALERAGWQVSEHEGVRNRVRFLIASPRRA
jgi:hypothetical protein